jgi:2-keto-4-pentenoate hydratase
MKKAREQFLEKLREAAKEAARQKKDIRETFDGLQQLAHQEGYRINEETGRLISKKKTGEEDEYRKK